MIPDNCKLERFFARWEFSVEHLLCASDVDGYPMPDLLALADDETRGLWEGLTLGYTETTGLPALREEIAQQYTALNPADVTVCGGGAAEALFLVANALLGPGTHAVVGWPAFEALHRVAAATGAEVTAVPLDPDAGWRLDPDAVRKALRPTTRALFLNFPHNPTGALPSRAEFEELVGIGTEAGITVVSDEVYRYLEYEPGTTLPAACDLDPRAISVGVMSKAYGLAGLRIGWLASRDEELLRTLRAIKDYTSVCASAPSEILALIALRAREQVVGRCRRIIDANLERVDEFFAEWADVFHWVRPRAGTVGFPRLLLATPVEEFVDDLARSESVLLLPGSVFDCDDGRVRFGLGRASLPEGLRRLDGYLRRTVRGRA
ncbi:MAG: aminotransferase class I/II-fold pyridoxal phosphate-dependent enzyme [Catenulispora sp.]|nr:aminotransferase class I/II-fold pyridoxal phosphate-dependent enzyme [Catenulispora sp.]